MATMAASQIDRSIINLLVEPLKVSFRLSDTQFGALQGVAFGMFYTFLALPSACWPIGSRGGSSSAPASGSSACSRRARASRGTMASCSPRARASASARRASRRRASR
jgi:hypothetical protein